ncbi:hypothetical protein CR513_01550, partial [Mucuna pruriens]
ISRLVNLILWLIASIEDLSSMEFRNFDPRHTGELLKHMDKQNEVLMEAYRSMLHELQKLQVEEEMLMRKMYEVMTAHGLTKRRGLILWMVIISLRGKENNDNPDAYNSGAEHPKKETNETDEEE